MAITRQNGKLRRIHQCVDASRIYGTVDHGGFVDGGVDFFATNRLVVIVPADNPGQVEVLADLAEPGLALVLALPGVPVRNYTDQFVGLIEADPAYGVEFNAGFYANVVSEEDNVRRVAAKVALGEADAGIVYISDVTADIAGDLRKIPIADEYNVTAVYPIASQSYVLLLSRSSPP